MTFKILLDKSHKIVCRSIVRSALDPDLLNLRLEPNFSSDLHPTIQADLLLEVEEKQRARQLELLDKQIAEAKIKQRKQFLDRVRGQLGNTNDIENFNDDDDADPPNTFVYLRGDGEHNVEQQPLPETLWKDFEVPLLDEHGEPRLDDNGELITVIAKDPKYLHSTKFLTIPDEHGEPRRARVVKLIGDFDAHLKTHEERAKALQDLQY